MTDFKPPRDRPFTRLAAKVMYGADGLRRLDTGRCPSCGLATTGFRDNLSMQEYRISGLCQVCQDKVFTEPKD